LGTLFVLILRDAIGNFTFFAVNSLIKSCFNSTGQHVYSKNSDREQHFHIKQIIMHPAYNQRTYDNDIALIQLDGEAQLNDHVNTICLPDIFHDFELAGRVCTVTGWGKTRNKTSTDSLKKADVPIVSQSVCNHERSYGGRLTWNMFCAGYQNGSSDSCSGDSGGPLQCLSNVKNRWVVSGIVSWGIGCGTTHKYGVYTRVRHFNVWVKGYIQKGGVPTPPKTPPIPPQTPPIPPQTPPIPPQTPPIPPQTPPIPPKTPPIPPTPPQKTTRKTTKKRRPIIVFPKNWRFPPFQKEWKKFLKNLRKEVIQRLMKQKH